MGTRLVALALLLVGLALLGWEWAAIDPAAAVDGVESLAPRAAPTQPVGRAPDDREALAPTAEPPPDPPPAATAAEDAGEPSWDELRPWATRVRAGVIEGVVLRGRVPVAGARVRLWTDFAVADPDARELPPAWEVTTDATGAFRFEGLQTGDHRVRADDGDAHVEKLARLHPDRENRRVVLMLGTAVIEGNVWDEHGAPLAGILVRMPKFGPQADGRTRDATARTDAAGYFRIAGLSAGSYWVIAERPVGEKDILRDEKQTGVGVGETRRVDFGRPYPIPRWTGELVDGSGVPVSGVRALLLINDITREELRAFTNRHGAVDAPVPEGAWYVWMNRASGDPVELGLLEMERADRVENFTIPGARLTVRILATEEGADAERIAELITLELWGVGRGPADGPEDAAGDRRSWLGLEPGTYKLTVHPPYRMLDPTHVEGNLPPVRTIEVPEGRPVVELDLTIAGP